MDSKDKETTRTCPPPIDLVYENSCPNVDHARERLTQALQECALPVAWREWEVNTPDTPKAYRQYGSPTILIRGKDVSGDEPATSCSSCRVYVTTEGYDTAPSVQQIVKALSPAV
ncbi:hypothetical protein [Paremcibacter congregatus]|uniref:Alkylmercury lyase n=1 Tax=Paremcibacter congregatus TaxID=2043170 RepID=A0A2G4YVX8_9PROT|nr:hypothetical protein [Paremcibacter congregatus]PHZ86487.1 hypothetical protein CRD36_00950 [Paremcibacter congregatus]QDE28418.1 hypothetical protein FIV45_14650 [Paremcibacter congregatus]|tara:strand:+ start:444 stop:788 length:345 start_codon:yes stop_codon:yes gene_type:complete